MYTPRNKPLFLAAIVAFMIPMLLLLYIIYFNEAPVEFKQDICEDNGGEWIADNSCCLGSQRVELNSCDDDIPVVR